MQTNQVSNQPQLYDQDYYLWLKTTQKQLATGDVSTLDIANLVEELADMGKSEKRAVESNLTILMMHLLKYQYQPKNVLTVCSLPFENIAKDSKNYSRIVPV